MTLQAVLYSILTLVVLTLSPLCAAAGPPALSGSVPPKIAPAGPLFTCRPQPGAGEVMLRVNGAPLYRETYEQLTAIKVSETWAYSWWPRKSLEEADMRLLEKLVREKLVEAEAAGLGITVSNKEIEERATAFRRSFPKGRSGEMSEEDVRVSQCIELLRERVLDKRIGSLEPPEARQQARFKAWQEVEARAQVELLSPLPGGKRPALLERAIDRVPLPPDPPIKPLTRKSFSVSAKGKAVARFVSIERLHVRSDPAIVQSYPGVDTNVIGIIPFNSEVEVYEQKGDWAKIFWYLSEKKSAGFVVAHYLASKPLTAEEMVARMRQAYQRGDKAEAAKIAEQYLGALRVSNLASHLLAGDFPGRPLVKEVLESYGRRSLFERFMRAVRGEEDFSIGLCSRDGEVGVFARYIPGQDLLRLIRNAFGVKGKAIDTDDAVSEISEQVTSTWFNSSSEKMHDTIFGTPFDLAWPGTVPLYQNEPDISGFLSIASCGDHIGGQRTGGFDPKYGVFATVPLFPTKGEAALKALPAESRKRVTARPGFSWVAAGISRQVLIGIGPEESGYRESGAVGENFREAPLVVIDAAGREYEARIPLEIEIKRYGY